MCVLSSSRHMMTPPPAGRQMLEYRNDIRLDGKQQKKLQPLQRWAAPAYNKRPFLFLLRGCSELYRMPVSEYKGSSSDSGSFEYKFPFRSNNNKWQRTSSSPQQSLTASPQPHTPNRAISLGSSVGKTLSAERLERGAVIPRSVSSDGRPLDTKRFDSLIRFLLFD